MDRHDQALLVFLIFMFGIVVAAVALFIWEVT